MDRLERYGRLRRSLLSRRFAFNGPGWVNFPTSEGTLPGLSSLADYYALSLADRQSTRRSTPQYQR